MRLLGQFFLRKIFFLRKDFVPTKNTKRTKSTKKHKHATKQKHKTQISKQKFKMCLKNIGVEKSNLFAYLHFSVFCAREEKK